MFRCQNQDCKTVTPSRQPENRMVTETRPKTYESKIRRGKQKGTYLTTHGSEIVKEIKLCPPCFKLLTGLKPIKAQPSAQKTSNKMSQPSYKRGKKQWTNPQDRKNRKDNYKGKKVQKKQEEPRKAPIVEVINPLPIVKN